MEYRDWSTGATGALTLTTSLSVGELYDNISAAQGSVGKTFGQGLLLVLFVIGALFLIIEVDGARRRARPREVAHRIGARSCSRAPSASGRGTSPTRSR